MSLFCAYFNDYILNSKVQILTILYLKASNTNPIQSIFNMHVLCMQSFPLKLSPIIVQIIVESIA